MAATREPSGGTPRRPPQRPGDGRGSGKPSGGVTRRQFLPWAGGGVAALAAAGAVGYELRGSGSDAPAKTVTQTTPAATPPKPALSQPFLTRPDLSPPVPRITQVSGAASGGSEPRFIALAPDNVVQNATPWQQGMMLIDRLGRLVWFEDAKLGKPFDLKVQSFDGKPVLTWWEGMLVSTFGSGKVQIADDTFNPIKTFAGASGLTADLHEFTITPSGDALSSAYQITHADLSSVKGARHGKIANPHGLLVDLGTGKTKLDWSALDHVALSESHKPLPSKGDELWDFFHLNSLQMLPDGNILVSSRNTWTVYKVNGQTGEIIWRLGGKRSDFQIPREARWAWQHHATLWNATTLTLFDNSGAHMPLTRALQLNVDESAMTVSLIRAFQNPTGFSSGTLGSVQLLPDGNVFVGWGSQPYFSEFASDGTLLAHGEMPIGTRSYRAFLVDFVGHPADKPRIVAKAYEAGGYVVYVSWNGATELASWRIEAGPHPRALKPVGSSPWTGFETSIVVASQGPSFQAVALDSDGHELGRSEIV